MEDRGDGKKLILYNITNMKEIKTVEAVEPEASSPAMVPAVETSATSVEQFITLAIEKGDISIVERVFALQKEIKAEKAKEAFDSAMAKAQGEFPIIHKNKEGGRTQGGAVAYKYAPIEDIVKQVQSVLKDNALSFSFKTEIGIEKVKVMCIAKHELGHSELSEMELPFGTKTNVMSAPQVVVATVTFAKRYTFCNVFGITVGGEDVDGKVAGPVLKPKDDRVYIMQMLKKLGVDITNKDNIPKEVKRLVKLDVSKEENLVEIKNRLEILVSEMQ